MQPTEPMRDAHRRNSTLIHDRKDAFALAPALSRGIFLRADSATGTGSAKAGSGSLADK
jgi:hypothetical protein